MKQIAFFFVGMIAAFFCVWVNYPKPHGCYFQGKRIDCNTLNALLSVKELEETVINRIRTGELISEDSLQILTKAIMEKYHIK